MAPVGAIETGREPSCFGRHFLHRGQNQHAPLRVGLALLIAHRPHEDAGAIAVAAHQIPELAQAFRIRRHHARLIENQHAQLVAGIEQLRRRRIVRGAQGVAAHLLQLANAVVLHGIRQRGAQPGMILVIAGSLHLDRARR